MNTSEPSIGYLINHLVEQVRMAVGFSRATYLIQLAAECTYNSNV